MDYMSQFMVHYRHYFVARMLCDECVEQDHFAEAAKPRDKCVGVAAALRTVNNFYLCHTHIASLSISYYRVS